MLSMLKASTTSKAAATRATAADDDDGTTAAVEEEEEPITTRNYHGVTVDIKHPVLVTGATGYVAGVLIKELLQLGLTVRGTVRNLTNRERFEYLEKVAEGTEGTLELFEADLMKEGSFAAATEGCAVVFHTASPFVYKEQVDDPYSSLIWPAVRGTRNVLNQATAAGTVKRVVLTASTMCINTDALDCENAPNKVLTEEQWNRSASPDYMPYSFSKVSAEQTAWTIAGSQRQWDMVVMNPGFIHGPGLKYHPQSESFLFTKMLGDGTTARSGVPNFGVECVDVRDVARAHIAAAWTPSAAGRYILTNGQPTTFPGMAASIAKKYGKEYPIAPGPLIFPKFVLWLLAPYVGMSRKSVWNNVDLEIRFDNNKSIRDLNMEYRPLDDTMQQMYQQIVDAGAVKTIRELAESEGGEASSTAAAAAHTGTTTTTTTTGTSTTTNANAAFAAVAAGGKENSTTSSAADNEGEKPTSEESISSKKEV